MAFVSKDTHFVSPSLGPQCELGLAGRCHQLLGGYLMVTAENNNTIDNPPYIVTLQTVHVLLSLQSDRGRVRFVYPQLSRVSRRRTSPDP